MLKVGAADTVGDSLGLLEGKSVGDALGFDDGSSLGLLEGTLLGLSDGDLQNRFQRKHIRLIDRKPNEIENTLLYTDLDGASEGILDGTDEIDGTAAYFIIQNKRVRRMGRREKALFIGDAVRSFSQDG